MFRPQTVGTVNHLAGKQECAVFQGHGVVFLVQIPVAGFQHLDVKTCGCALHLPSVTFHEHLHLLVFAAHDVLVAFHVRVGFFRFLSLRRRDHTSRGVLPVARGQRTDEECQKREKPEFVRFLVKTAAHFPEPRFQSEQWHLPWCRDRMRRRRWHVRHLQSICVQRG